MAKISYKLVQPEKVIKQGNAWGVVLPAGNVNLTVIEGQSPSIVKFDDGMIQILDEDGKVAEKYFAKAGVATIAENVCIAASETIIASERLDYDDVLERAKSDPFFEMISIKMATF